MKFKLNKTQLIGLFVVITLTAIYFVINFLQGEDIFKKRITYYAVFENVEGLTPTSPVYIRGLKVGSVESIKYDNKKWNFTVRLSVKTTYAVPANSKVEIYSADILGGKSIRISLGDSYSDAAAGDTLASATIPDMLSVFSSEMGPLKDQAALLMQNMNSALDKINAILNPKAQNDIAKTLENLNATMQNATAISENLRNSSPEITATLNNLQIITDNLKAGSGDLNATLKNANTISKGLSEADLKGTIEELKTLVVKLKDPNGTFGKLMATDSLHNSVTNTVNNLNNLIEKISNNPRKYIRISVF
jgi:phospholipid/cholesterol/gamma-HCH transport system substrate-binding protein